MAYVFMHDKALTTTQMSHNAPVSLSHTHHIYMFFTCSTTTSFSVLWRCDGRGTCCLPRPPNRFPHPPIELHPPPSLIIIFPPARYQTQI